MPTKSAYCAIFTDNSAEEPNDSDGYAAESEHYERSRPHFGDGFRLQFLHCAQDEQLLPHAQVFPFLRASHTTAATNHSAAIPIKIHESAFMLHLYNTNLILKSIQSSKYFSF